jgi:hypothetical protein
VADAMIKAKYHTNRRNVPEFEGKFFDRTESGLFDADPDPRAQELLKVCHSHSPREGRR